MSSISDGVKGEIMEAFSVKWRECDDRERIVVKQKRFKTDQLREKFIAALTEKQNFREIIAWSDRSAVK
jgi:thymidylate synthase